MRRISWPEIVATPWSRYLLVALLDESFGGGPRGDFDSDRLRFAANLMKRCCTGLRFQGNFAVQASRNDSQPQVHVSTDAMADFLSLGILTGSKPLAAPPWKGQGQFLLDEDLHQQLLEVAGAPDSRGAGRRARERKEAEVEERSLRWKVSAQPHRG